MRRRILQLALFLFCLATIALTPQPPRAPTPSSKRIIEDDHHRIVTESLRRQQGLWLWVSSLPKAAAKQAPKQTEESQHVAHYDGDVWSALAQCESGMTNANTGNGFFGFFQFVPATFRSLGYEGLPTDYSYETQREAAQTLQARSGWGQWPACSRKLGLR